MALEITNMVNETKNNLAKEINKSITYVYWNIGKIIVKHENEDNNRLEYGKEVLKGLSKELTKLLGKGYSYTNLTYMRWFYNTYPDYSKISESFGYIGYTILKEYRGLGYATQGLKLAIDKCKNLIKENEIYLRIEKQNKASLKVQYKCGAYLVNEDQEHYFTRIKLNKKI